MPSPTKGFNRLRFAPRAPEGRQAAYPAATRQAPPGEGDQRFAPFVDHVTLGASGLLLRFDFGG